MLELRYPNISTDNFQLKDTALAHSLPENMRHFDDVLLPKYKYLNHDRGLRVNPISDIIRGHNLGSDAEKSTGLSI